MSAFSDYLENKIIDWLRGVSMPAAPANTYIKMYSTVATDTGGTVISSISTVTIPSASWTKSTGTDNDGKTYTQLTNNVAITISNSIVTPVTIKGFGVYTVDDDLLFYGNFATDRVVIAGDQVKFNANTLTVKLY